MPPLCQAQEKRPWKKRFWVSVALVAAASVADVHSSRGLAEANPLLRNRQGGIDVARGVWIKSATVGGVVLLETLLLNKAPEHRLEKPFTVINTLAAGAVTFTAARNYRIPRASPGAPSR
ncbi:MAG TPA: hypothetical protein VLH09_08445 [Bryobacteraceae bacterium]|nr:hypothetical protein [Bryobacteraceae bacterium]